LESQILIAPNQKQKQRKNQNVKQKNGQLKDELLKEKEPLQSEKRRRKKPLEERSQRIDVVLKEEPQLKREKPLVKQKEGRQELREKLVEEGRHRQI
jgi:hypothetical protein